ncbi:hypothetical protein [Candidatus Methylomicrobium oryzae]|jgi:hypothetical protein|uniref:hypothetical protein n=1 Tax=Candidatus Methylomicrobium oryzae TaxID=2802053 RepID=UPI0019223E52|nr:hypothetical protein [Methylomicrobium sp. RS1]MBL1262832.1 hypothetical protein [Methylomicrobium sp. RS1]
MRTGAIICLAIFVIWVVIALLQLWFALLSGEIFLKLTITAAALFVVVLGAALVVREYVDEKKMKDDGYID